MGLPAGIRWRHRCEDGVITSYRTLFSTRRALHPEARRSAVPARGRVGVAGCKQRARRAQRRATQVVDQAAWRSSLVATAFASAAPTTSRDTIPRLQPGRKTRDAMAASTAGQLSRCSSSNSESAARKPAAAFRLYPARSFMNR